AGDFGEAGGKEGFHDGFGRHAFSDGGPIEFEEAAGVGVAGEEADDAREESVHVPFADGESALGVGAADFEHENAAARFEDAMEFAKERNEVFDVTQRVTHGDE